jgi:hypothetical protein
MSKSKRNPRRPRKRRRNVMGMRPSSRESEEVDLLATLGWTALSIVVTTTATYFILKEVYVREVVESCTNILHASQQQAAPSPTQLEAHARAIL